MDSLMAHLQTRKGTRYVCDAPDAGPWHMTTINGLLYAAPATSGLYLATDQGLKRLGLTAQDECPSPSDSPAPHAHR